MLQGKNDLSDVSTSLLLSEASVVLPLEDLGEIATAAVLEDQEQVPASLEALLETDNERVASGLLKNRLFGADEAKQVGVVDHLLRLNLDGVCLLVPLIGAQVNLAKRSFTDVVRKLVVSELDIDHRLLVLGL